MKLRDLFPHLFPSIEREAAVLEVEAKAVEQSVLHFIEKELNMSLPQNIVDAIAHIRELLSSHSGQGAADAATIADLRAQLADLQAKCAGHEATIADLTAAGAAKDAQISDLNSQIADIEAQLVALAGDPAAAPAPQPAPAPADGSASGDVLP